MNDEDEDVELGSIVAIEDRPYIESDSCWRPWTARLACLTDAEAEAVGKVDARIEVELRDLRTGRTFNTAWRNSAKSLQRVELGGYGNDEETDRFRWSLFDYGIAAHFCPCHRTPDDSEGFDDEEDCQHGRWLIAKATHAALPGVVLYAERGEYVAPSERKGMDAGRGGG